MMNPAILLRASAALIFAIPSVASAGPVAAPDAVTALAPEPEPWYRLAGIYQYLQLDYLGSADAVTYTLEFENQFRFPWFDIENRLILDWADFPVEIKDPQGNPFSINGAGSGIGDLLVGTFFAPKNQGHHFHWGFGPMLQIPTASDDNLGSGKWTLGPGFHLEWHYEKFSAGLFIWNSWSIAGDSNRHSINQLTAKPYFIYEFAEDWSLLYIPLGISATWNKPSGERWKIPLGGGVGHKFHLWDQDFQWQAQGFYSVARPKKAPDWSVRFTLEMPL